MDETTRAMERAMRSLAMRAHSEQEIVDKLTRAEFGEQIIAQVMAKLSEYRLIDDETFAAGWAASSAARGLGPRRILRDLSKKGIDTDRAERAVASVSEETYLERAERLALRQLLKNDPSARKRAHDALIRRGYDFDMARAALDRAAESVQAQMLESPETAPDPDELLDAAEALALKHLEKGGPSARQKAYAALLRKGYDRDTAEAAMGRALDEAARIAADRSPEEVEAEDAAELAEAIRLASKAIARADKDAARRAYAALRRRGYAHALAQEAVDCAMRDA